MLIVFKVDTEVYRHYLNLSKLKQETWNEELKRMFLERINRYHPQYINEFMKSRDYVSRRKIIIMSKGI